MRFRETVLKRVSMVPAFFMLGTVIGCGGGAKFTGYIPPGGGIPPSPAISTISPDVAIAGGAAFTLTVRGNNFASDSTVEWNGNPLPTTFISGMELQAHVAASEISTAGSAAIDLDTQKLGASNSLPLTIESGAGFTLSNVAIQANDMVWDPTSQQIYLSVLSSNGTNANTITALNPSNGQLGVAQNAGSGPDQLALASDGSYLYAGIDGSASVQRFTLPGLGTDISIPIGLGSNIGPYYAMELEAAPASPHTIAVVRGMPNESPSDQGGVVIYDDAVARPTSVPGANNAPYAEIDSIQWGSDVTHLYGENDNSSDLYVLSVDANGVQIANDYKGAFASQVGLGPFVTHAKLHYDATTGYLYSDDGQVVNPSTGAVVGSYGTSGAMVPDSTLQLAYFLGQTTAEAGGPDYTLTAFDLTTFARINSIIIPSVAGIPVKLIRWGTNGLVFLTNNNNSSPSTPIPGMGVYFISGPFVTSPALRTQPLQ